MKQTKEFKKKKYNCENKNRIREKIIEELRKRNINSILTLESPDFLFSKELPDKKIIVFENEAEVMKRMENKCPKNVELVFANVGKFGVIGKQVDMIYLDFCGTWMTEQNEIVRLNNRLKETKLFVLTLCMRTPPCFGNMKDIYKGDYQFDLISKIQELTGINWKVVYGESYYDSVQMVTIILENKDKEQW